MPRRTADRLIGVVVLIFAGLLLCVWIPLDVDGGYIERVRRQTLLGDAMAPTCAGVLMAFAALTLLFSKPKTGPGTTLDRASLTWVLSLGLLLAASLLIMRWAGPAVAGLFAGEDYRMLRASAPWKFIGFLLGATGLIAGMIAIVERRLVWWHIAIGLSAALAIAMFYDLPFDDLQLPPNGDV